MGLGLFASVLILSQFLTPLASQNPNTDGFYISNLLQKIGSKSLDFSGSYCSWKGVFCDPTGQYIVRLEFSNLGLFGVIPENTIGKMSKLEHLDLGSNGITTLPLDFWGLSSLKSLNLSSNQFSGDLPNNIGNFFQLERLDLSSNVFSGTIPEAIGGLTNLMDLDLSNNMFGSSIPLGILQCSSLVLVDLSGNKLNGSLPTGLGAAFPVLEILNLADNRISGSVSDLIGMKLIRYVNVSGNLFEGSVGVFAGPVQFIDLSRNLFDGNLGQVTLNPSSLLYLDVSENQFRGKFPADLICAVNLKHLNLANNRFSDQPFLRIDMFSNLDYLNLSGTNLTGDIPGEISGLSSLRILDLSSNKLVGQIPSKLLEHLHGMQSFNFSNNHLSFCPSEFSNNAITTSFKGLVNICPVAVDPGYFERNDAKRTGLKLGLVLSLSLIFLLVLLLFLGFRRRRNNRMWVVRHDCCEEERAISGRFDFQADLTTWENDVKQAPPTTVPAPVPLNCKQAVSAPVVIFEKPLLNFTYANVMSATHNFDPSMLLAEGRFGPVYAAILPGGVHVAIKVLVRGSIMTDLEAARELDYLGRIRHSNLVSLTGYCLAGDQRIVIYEYMDNGTLQNLLYDSPIGPQITVDTREDENNGRGNIGVKGLLMSWRFRYKILLGTARALAFLHHGCSPPIIHRDVKASSIYFDHNIEPRLSHFGLGKIFGNALEDDITRGSPAYIAPELLEPESTFPSTKSDVFGYGVILFELLTGQKPVGDYYLSEKDSNLVSWVRGQVRMNNGLSIIDPKIRGKGPEKKMIEALKIGYLCTAEVPAKRPSMQQVVGLLKDLEPIMD